MNKMLIIHGAIFLIGILISRECCHLNKTTKVKCSYQKSLSRRLERSSSAINHLDIDVPGNEILIVYESNQVTDFFYRDAYIFNNSLKIIKIRGPPVTIA